jgi:antitoxin (DNA-binding transcriptional repressor) of toxin-antitoxin stability system
MDKTITPDYLMKHLSAVLKRVREEGDEFLIAADGEPVARLGPFVPHGVTAEELVRRVGDLPMPGNGFADDLEAIHAAQGEAELPKWRS